MNSLNRAKDLHLDIWGTTFFVILASHFLGLEISKLVDFDLVETFFYSVLATKTLAFWLLAWFLVLLVRFGPKYLVNEYLSFRGALKSHAYRLLARRYFLKAFFWSSCLFMCLFIVLKSLGALSFSYNHFEGKSLWSSYFMISDPLASFVFYFVFVDWLRLEFLKNSLPSSPVLGFVLAASLETLVWMDFFNLTFNLVHLLLVLSASIFYALISYRAILQSKRSKFWERFALGLVSFFTLSILTNILTTTWTFSWSFFSVSSPSPELVKLCALILLLLANAAVLQRFCSPLTRTE